MIEEKAWWKSKTIWGAFVAVAAQLLALTGVTIDTGTQVSITEAIIQAVGAGGALIAIYGRLMASAELK